MADWVHWLSLASQVALGILGAVVSLLNDWAGRHKVGLLIVFTALVLTSVLGTHQEWVEAAREKAVADQKLSDSLNSLGKMTAESARMTNLNSELQQRLLESNNTIRTLSQQNFDQLTGGSSYPIITPLPVLTEQNAFRLTMSVRGENTLWDVIFRVIEGRPPYNPTQEELARMLAGQGWTDVGTLNPGQGKPLSYVIHPLADGNESAWTINVYARNGATAHFLEMRFNREGNYWERQYRIRKDDVVILEQAWERFGM